MPDETSPERILRISLRIPESVHERIVAMAVTDRRSLNAEMVYLLEQAAEEATPPPPAPSDAL